MTSTSKDSIQTCPYLMYVRVFNLTTKHTHTRPSTALLTTPLSVAVVHAYAKTHFSFEAFNTQFVE